MLLKKTKKKTNFKTVSLTHINMSVVITRISKLSSCTLEIMVKQTHPKLNYGIDIIMDLISPCCFMIYFMDKRVAHVVITMRCLFFLPWSELKLCCCL